MRESQIEDEVVRFAESRGYLTRKVSYVGRRNAADRFFARKDRGLVWMEFKAPGKKPRPGQEREHARMQKAGMIVFVVDSIEYGCSILS